MTQTESGILKKTLQPGDKVRLIKYGPYADYEKHMDQIATITNKISNNLFTHNITWDDGKCSYVNIKNLRKVDHEWDTEENEVW